MNIRQGLFRLWILGSVFWIGNVAYTDLPQFMEKHPFAQEYQLVLHTKLHLTEDDVEKKPYYEQFIAPTKDEYPMEYSLPEDKYVEQWEKNPFWTHLKFPDKSHVWVVAQMTDEDKEFVLKDFWDHRWRRYAEKVWPSFSRAFGPPFAIIFIAYALAWVLRGFNDKRA